VTLAQPLVQAPESQLVEVEDPPSRIAADCRTLRNVEGVTAGPTGSATVPGLAHSAAVSRPPNTPLVCCNSPLPSCRLVGYLDAQPLFDVTDGDQPAGQVGLFCSANPGARFGPVTVARPPLDAYAVFRDQFGLGDLSAWTITDDGAASGPSAWTVSMGELTQTSLINSPPASATDVARRGTQALAGDPAWTDVLVSGARRRATSPARASAAGSRP
jgi:hypothetical protein